MWEFQDSRRCVNKIELVINMKIVINGIILILILLAMPNSTAMDDITYVYDPNIKWDWHTDSTAVAPASPSDPDEKIVNGRIWKKNCALSDQTGRKCYYYKYIDVGVPQPTELTLTSSNVPPYQDWCCGEWYYNDQSINKLDVNLQNWWRLYQRTGLEISGFRDNNNEFEEMKKILSNSGNGIISEGGNLIARTQDDLIKTWQQTLEVREVVLKASINNKVNKVNSEINNATSIGADTKEALAKLEEAKKALSDGNYANASLFAGKAYDLARISNVDIGYRSIKDLMSFNTEVYSKYQPHKVIVETGGFVRDIKSSGASYSFVIDDGNGVISVYYSGGLGDIKEGDSVSVKGVYNSQNINAESVTKGSGLVGGISSNVKVPGFEVILAISIIGALWLRRKL